VVIPLAAALALLAMLLFPDALVGAARAVGYTVCHQWPEHSFAAAGQPFPLCARCTGTYFGAMLALGFIWATGRGKAGDWPSKPVLALLAIGFGAMIVDGINSFVDVLSDGRLHLYAPTNALRFITGGANGIVLVSLGLPLLNYVFWSDWARRPSLRSIGEPIGLAVGLLIGVAVLGTAAPALLPVFSLLTVVGVLTLFTGINTALWLLAGGREQSAAALADILPHLGVGLCMTAGELLLLGLGRSALERYVLHLG
jgi:uncharacterized membrane protein